jgi:hypothetical protein
MESKIKNALADEFSGPGLHPIGLRPAVRWSSRQAVLYTAIVNSKRPDWVWRPPAELDRRKAPPIKSDPAIDRGLSRLVAGTGGCFGQGRPAIHGMPVSGFEIGIGG